MQAGLARSSQNMIVNNSIFSNSFVKKIDPRNVHVKYQICLKAVFRDNHSTLASRYCREKALLNRIKKLMCVATLYWPFSSRRICYNGNKHQVVFVQFYTRLAALVLVSLRYLLCYRHLSIRTRNITH